MTIQHDTDRAPPKPRGFAALSKEAVQAMASKGGKAAHAAGTAHEWTKETAREAGRKGGRVPRVNRKAREI